MNLELIDLEEKRNKNEKVILTELTPRLDDNYKSEIESKLNKLKLKTF